MEAKLPNSNYRITAIGEEDFAQLIALFNDFALFEKLPEKMTNTVEQMMQEKEHLNGFTIKDVNNCICGYVTFFFAYYTWTGKCLYMDDLYVCPEYRGQGFGSTLIEKVIAFAKESHCHKMRWQVSEWNASAIRFYESLGAKIDHVEMNCDLPL